MGLFSRKNKNISEVKLELSEEQKTIYKYITECLQSGRSLESVRNSLEEHKEIGNYSSEDIKQAIDFLEQDKDSSPKLEINEDVSIKKEMKKLPRKRRKAAVKLLEMYNKGQVLRPNEDVDNKKIIMDNK